MASCFDAIARLDVVCGDSDSLKPQTAGRFKGPHLSLTFCVFDFHIDPGMRNDQMHFLHHTLNVHECVFIVAVRMVWPRRYSEGGRANESDTNNQFKPHAYLL